MNLTHHARQRCQQRCIQSQRIQIALDYGRPARPYVLVLDDRSLEGTPYQHRTAELRGLCVVLTPDGAVRTVMWDYNLRRRPGRQSGAAVRRRCQQHRARRELA